jgi:glycosyltransferase involved in cell wall biosynthesis
MMNNTPKVSVIIPSYNSAAYMDEAIQSVLNQTFENFELIIVDDCSPDDTDSVVQKYLGDKRVSYYKNSSNLGLSGNWNKALKFAKGDYIKFLCSDDKFHPQLLEKFVVIMDQYPQVSLVSSYREEFGLAKVRNEPPFAHLQKGQKIIVESLKERNWIGEPTCVMFRKENLRFGEFNPQYIYYIDWDMWLRQLSIGDCYIIPEILSYFRVHEKQVSKMVMKTFLNYFEVFKFYKNIRDNNPYKIDFAHFDIDFLVKQKAIKCANATVKLIPGLYKKENRILFHQAIKIIQSEKVLFSSFVEILKGANRQFVNLIRRKKNFNQRSIASPPL